MWFTARFTNDSEPLRGVRYLDAGDWKKRKETRMPIRLPEPLRHLLKGRRSVFGVSMTSGDPSACLLRRSASKDQWLQDMAPGLRNGSWPTCGGAAPI